MRDFAVQGFDSIAEAVRMKYLNRFIFVKYLNRFIFIHINKTGGSSVESALGLPFTHLTAREWIADIGENRWRRRFSFAFVRNPWDRVASQYYFRVMRNHLGTNPIPFNDWVRRAYGEHDPRFYDRPKMFMPQSDWITDERGEVLVDFVGAFERFEDDFRFVRERIGRRAELPHVKQSKRRDFREIYVPETRAIVAEGFAGDIDRFGYSFEGGGSRLPFRREPSLFEPQ